MPITIVFTKHERVKWCGKKNQTDTHACTSNISETRCSSISKCRIVVFCTSRFSFVCLCFTSLQQRGHLETAPPYTVPCEGREAR